MKIMTTVRKYGSRIAVAGLALGSSAAALADAAAAATTISGTSSDVQTLGWAAIGVLAVAAGFKYIRRAI